MCQVLTHCGFSEVLLDGNCAYEPSDLRHGGSLSPTTRHHCTHVLVYRPTSPGGPRRLPSQLRPGPALLNFSDRVDTDELPPYSVHGRPIFENKYPKFIIFVQNYEI